jgi:hypothetical protein
MIPSCLLRRDVHRQVLTLGYNIEELGVGAIHHQAVLKHMGCAPVLRQSRVELQERRLNYVHQDTHLVEQE